MKRVLLDKLVLIVVTTALTTLLIACQDALPVNPYDPRTPVTAQARGLIRGTLFLDDAAVSPPVIHGELQSLTVRLLDAAGEQLLVTSCAAEASAAASTLCDDGARTASFELKELPAGVYRVVVDGVSPRYVPVAIPSLTLLPGEVKDLGTLRYAVLPIDVPDAEWTGRVEVEVRLAAGEGGARRVTLFRQGSSGLGAHAVALTDGTDRARFEQVPPGVYAVAAELESYTPDYRVGFSILGADAPVEGNTQAFTGSSALTLHPVTAVVIPALQQTFGEYYTGGDVAPVQVMQFGGMNQMRLSTDAGFASGTATWVEYAAAADVTLPSTEGVIAIFAQFRNTRVAGFEFVSNVYRTRVVRDVSASQVLGVRVRGRTAGDDGKIWYASDAQLLSVEVDGQDAVSAVYSYALYHDVANSAGDPSQLSFTLTESPGGLVRLDEELGLTTGEGEKRVFVYLKDRAGNVSAAGEVSVWVDTTAPVVDALELGTAWTGQPVLAVALQASDANEVVAMQVWEEGQAVPAPVPFAEVWTVQLSPLDHARTQRQVNALVQDQAGNLSLLSSAQLIFDDRGALTGVLTVEDAADGSAGSSAGVTAQVDGVSRPVQFTATGARGEYDVVVSGIPAGVNRQLVLLKAGYADASARAPFAVEAGVATAVGSMRLQLARGRIEGWVVVEGNAEHSNAIARVEGTELLALTDAGGHFVIDEVPARAGYTVSIRYDEGHGTELITGVDVPAGGVRQVSTSGQPIVLPILAGSFSIMQGAYTGAQRVQLRMAYDGATQYRASEERGELEQDLIGWSAFSNAVGSTTGYDFDLGTGEGVHAVYVQFQDPAAGASPIFQDAVTLDTQDPVISALRVDEGTGYTADQGVVVSITATDATPIVSYQVAQRDTTEAGDLVDGDFGGTAAYNNQPVPVTLLGSSFYTARVWMRVIDAAGNVSAPLLASVVLDPLAPTGGSLVINGGDDVTSSLQVTLTLAASDDSPLTMLLGNNAVPATGSWQAFEPSLGWTLSPIGGSTRRVCVAFRDPAGNDATDLCDDIGFDATPPPLPDVTLTSGTPTSDPQLTLTLNNVTADVTGIQVATNGAFAGAQAYPDQGQVTFGLAGSDGTYSVFVRYLDAAGNASPAQVVSVELDRQAPQSVDLVVVDGTYTRSLRPELRLSALGARWMRISATADCAGGSDEDFATQGFVDLVAPDSVKDLSVAFTDAAGNSSACVHRQVTLDRAPPATGVPPIALSGLKFVLNAAQDAVDAAYVRVDLSATDATPLQMKLSNVDGCGDVGWIPYSGLISEHRLLAGDGPRTVYAIFEDAAGNPSAQVSATVPVDSTGELTGVLALEGSVDYSDVVIELDGVEQSYAMATNRFTISNMLTKQYNSFKLRKPGYDEVVLASGVYVPGGSSADVGTLTVKRSRGRVEGYVELSGDATHAGVVVELLNTGYTTVSNSAGFFTMADVLAGTYTLVARKDGYSPRTYTPVVVQSQLTTRVPPSGSLLLSQQQGDFEINGEQGGFSNAQTVTLNLSYTDSVRYRASVDSTFSGGTDAYETFAAQSCVSTAGNHDCPFDLPDSDGQHTVYVQFEYGSPAQESEVLQSSVTLDRVRPDVGTLLIQDGLTHTRELTANVALSSTDQPFSGVVQMQLSTDGSTWQTAIPFALNHVWSYADPTTGSPNPDDTLCLWARFIDAAGNLSSDTVAGAATDCIVLDRQAPTPGAPPLHLQSAQGTALNGTLINTSGVYLVADATGAAQMRFSNQSNLAGATWRSYGTTQQDWALAAGDGSRPVYVAYQDEAGNTVGDDGALFASVTVDTAAPLAPIFAVSEGIDTSSTTVHVDFSNRIQGSENLTVVFQSNRDLTQTTDDTSGNDPAAYALPDVEGLHILTLRYRDLAGNESLVSSASITLDRTDPEVEAFAVEGSGYTRTGVVDLSLTAPGAADMRFGNNGSSWSAWTPFSSRRTGWSVDTSVQGPRTVWVQVRDAAGNLSPGLDQATVVFDSARPTLATVAIEGGASHVRSTAVTLQLQAADLTSGVAQMRLANGTSPGGEFEPYVTARAWELAAGLDGDRHVTVEFSDRATNTSATTAHVVLDRAAPTVVSFTVQGNAGEPAGYSYDGTVNLAVSGNDATDPDGLRYCFSNDASFASATCGELTTGATHTASTTGWTLAGTSGQQVVHVRLRDRAGNEVYGSASIVVDGEAPAAASFAISEAPYALSETVHLIAGAVGATDVRVSESGTYANNGWRSLPLVNPDDTYTFSTSEGARVLYAWFRDAARNVTPRLSASTCLDLQPPTADDVTVYGWSYISAGLPVDVLTEDDTRTLLEQVELVITASDSAACSGVAEMKISNDSNFPGANHVPFTNARVPWTLASGAHDDLAHPIYVKVKDSAGRESTSHATGSIFYDNVGPYSPSIVAAGGADFATSTTVPVTLSAQGSGALYARYDERPDLANMTTWDPAPWPAVTVTITTGPGLRSVFVKYRDLVGNQSAVASDSVIVDTDPPVAGATPIAIVGNPAGFVSTTTVGAQLDATGASEVKLSESPLFTGASWLPYAANQTFSLTSTQGSKIVYVCFRDRAENLDAACAAGTPASAAVTLDSIAPTAPRFRPPSSDLVDTDALTVSLATPSSDTNLDRYETRGGLVPTWTNQGTATSYSLGLMQDSLNTLRVRAVDRAGNISDEDFVMVMEDSTAPGRPILSDVRVFDASVEVSWQQPADSDLVGYRVYYGGTAELGGTFAAQGASPIDIAPTQSLRLTGLANGSAVHIAVAAVDHLGKESPLSAIQHATPDQFFPKPVGPMHLEGGLWFGGVGRYLFAVDDTSGVFRSQSKPARLAVFDAQNARPRFLSSLWLYDEITGVLDHHQRGDLLYLLLSRDPAAGTDRLLVVVDVGRPVEPKLVGLRYLAASARTLAATDATLYVGGAAGVEIYDAIDPASMVQVGTLAGLDVTALDVDDAASRLWLLATEAATPRLKAYDLTSPLAPSLRATLNLSGYLPTRRLRALGDDAVVAGKESSGTAAVRVRTYHLSGSSISQTGQVNLSNGAWDDLALEVSGSSALLAWGSSSPSGTALARVDLTNLAAPSLAATTTLTPGYRAGGIAYCPASARVYVYHEDGGGSSALHERVASDLSAGRSFSAGDLSTFGIAIDKGLAFIPAKDNQSLVCAVDLSVASAPTPMGCAGPGGVNRITNLKTDGRRVFAGAQTGVYALDFSNPYAPTVLASYACSGNCGNSNPYAAHLSLYGRYLFAAHENSGFVRIFDVSGPLSGSLTPVASLDPATVARPSAIAMDGSILVVASNDSVAVDVYSLAANPLAPTLLFSGTLTARPGLGFTLSGDALLTNDANATSNWYLYKLLSTGLTLQGQTLSGTNVVLDHHLAYVDSGAVKNFELWEVGTGVSSTKLYSRQQAYGVLAVWRDLLIGPQAVFRLDDPVLPSLAAGPLLAAQAATGVRKDGAGLIATTNAPVLDTYTVSTWNLRAPIASPGTGTSASFTTWDYVRAVSLVPEQGMAYLVLSRPSAGDGELRAVDISDPHLPLVYPTGFPLRYPESMLRLSQSGAYDYLVVTGMDGSYAPRTYVFRLKDSYTAPVNLGVQASELSSFMTRAQNSSGGQPQFLLAGSSSGDLVCATLDTATGAITLGATVSPGGAVQGVDTWSDGTSTYAYLLRHPSWSANTLYVYQVSSSCGLTLLGSQALAGAGSGSSVRFAVRDGYVYIAGDSSLYTIDARNPAAIATSPVATLVLPGAATTLLQAGDPVDAPIGATLFAQVAFTDWGSPYTSDRGYLQAIDLAAPAAPILMASPVVLGPQDGASSGVTGSVSRDGASVVLGVTVQKAGTYIYDVTVPTAPDRLAKLDWPNWLSVSEPRRFGPAMFLTPGNSFYQGFGGIPVVLAHSFTTNLLPTPIAQGPVLHLLGDVRGMAIDSGYLLVGDSAYGLVVYNVFDPASPGVAGRAPLSGGDFRLLGIWDGLAYMSDGASDEIEILSIADPTAPVGVGSLTLPGQGLVGVTDAAVEAGRIYMLVRRPSPQAGQIVVVDASMPSAPVLDQVLDAGEQLTWNSHLALSEMVVYFGRTQARGLNTRSSPASWTASFVPDAFFDQILLSGPYFLLVADDVGFYHKR